MVVGSRSALYTDQGLIDPNITTGIFNTNFYGEYGLTDRLTAITYVPFFARAFNNNQVSATTGEILLPGEAINSIGDIDIGLKYGLTRPGSPVAVSATLMLGLPSGQSIGGSQGNLQTGDGEFNQLLRVDAGHGWASGSTNFFVNAYTGFNNRTEGFSDEFRYGLEGGAGFKQGKLWLIGRLDAVRSLRNGLNSGEVINTTSIFANNTEYVSIGGEVAYYLTPEFGVSAGMAGAVSGRIILAAPSYNVGVFWDF